MHSTPYAMNPPDKVLDHNIINVPQDILFVKILVLVLHYVSFTLQIEFSFSFKKIISRGV